MATYRFIGSSQKVYIQPDLSNPTQVGTISNGAIIEGTIVSGGWMAITSINDPYNTCHRGIVNGMYCKSIFSGRSLFEEVNGTSNAEVGDSMGETDENFIDDEFTKSFSSVMTDEEYRANLEEGLRVSNLRGIMGMPPQFLPTADPRIDLSDDDDAFGRVYSEKIVKPMPLMFMTPGTPSFMSSFNNRQKDTILRNIFAKTDKIGDFDNLVSSGGGKYYSLKYAYVEYFGFVNPMLRSAAFFLGIEDETLDIDDEVTGTTNGGTKLSSFNWYYSNQNSGVVNDDIFDNNGLSKYLGTYTGAIPFYIEAETRTSDDFSNSTSQSSLANSIDGLSDTARELNYIIGNVSGSLGAGQLYDDLMSVGATDIESTSNTINSLLGRGNVLSNIMSKVQTILSGGRMIFPEIWSDSSFSRSYRISIKLTSPSGDKLSIFYNILVPIYHLIAFVLPRNSTGQSYYSPFLVRAYYKGIFNIDMGIITDMSITKGSDGEWTPDGLPTTAEVSFEIKDLYDALSMSKAEKDTDRGILSNIAELDYIANSCGININEPEIGRTIKMAMALGFTDKIQDKVTMNIFGGISQYFNQKIQNIFGKF